MIIFSYAVNVIINMIGLLMSREMEDGLKKEGMVMLSFFYREAFLNVNPSEPLRLRTKPIKAGHVMRVSSMIRGDQIAEYLGAKVNPTEGYENDICIYIKP